MSESGNIISLDNMKHGAVQTICVITDIMSTITKYVGRQRYPVHDNNCPISVRLAGSAVEPTANGLGSRSQRSWHRQNNIAQRGIVSSRLRHRSSENPG
jgi:hypothetical protein